MAVAAPVLERRTAVEERSSRVYNAAITDEEHNSRIRQNYARLINPENKIDAALDRAPAETVEAPVAQEQRVSYAQPAFVENARADADIFNAHSEMNLRLAAQQKQTLMEMSSEEDEDEDLRPTLTTIQYKTTGVKNTVEEGKIENTGVEKRAGLSKKDKIVIAAIVGVILVMLILVIVNSAVLSNINGDVSSLQSSLTVIKGSYEGVKDEINLWVMTEEDIANIAKELGWIHV